MKLTMLIRNANALIDGRFVPETDVLIHAGKIQAVGYKITADHEEEIVDLDGDYLLPGFVDVHIHGYDGAESMAGEASIRSLSRSLKKGGLAAFLVTTVCSSAEKTAQAIAGIRAVMQHPEKDGALVLGAHMEGPFLCEEKCGALLKEYFVLPSEDNFERLTGGAAEAVRLITMAPELPDSLAFIAHAKARGIHVSIGHTTADAKTVHLAADYGADHVTHTFNAQSSLHHRNPGVPGAAMVDDRLFCEVICDGVHVHPDVVRLIARCKGPEHMAAVTDAMSVTGFPEGEYFASGHKVFVRSDAVYLENGTLCGSNLTMAKAFKNLIDWGIAPQDAAVMTTQTPARSIGAYDVGVIREGACGILVHFNKAFTFIQTLG